MLSEALQRAEQVAPRLAARAADHDRDASFPVADFDDLRHEGLLGLMVPLALGGMGAGFEEYTKVAMALARGNAATALVFNMHASVTGALAGIAPELARALGATEAFFEERDRVLRAAAGGALYGVAISEAGAGSRLSLLQSTYHRDGDGYRIRGTKSACSGAGHLDAYLVAARAAGGGDAPVISYFLVPDAPGIEVEPGWDPLGMRATASHTVRFDVRVPVAALLGGVEGLALPLAYAMPQWLVASYAAVYVGLGQAAVAEATGYLEKVHGAKGTVTTAARARLGRAEAAVEASRLAVEHAARLVDVAPGEPDTNQWIHRAKLLAGDTAMGAAASLAEACGLGALGRGSPLERIFRDARSGAIMPPRSDICADYLGANALGLDPRSVMEAPPW